jgi:hypothetical protein
MIELLTVHTYLEYEVMYPEVRKVLPDLEDDVLESYEEHHVADVLCRELLELDPTNEHFDAKTTVLIENVEHHMAEEEQEWFPKVRSANPARSPRQALHGGERSDLHPPRAASPDLCLRRRRQILRRCAKGWRRLHDHKPRRRTDRGMASESGPRPPDPGGLQGLCGR